MGKMISHVPWWFWSCQLCLIEQWLLFNYHSNNSLDGRCFCSATSFSLFVYLTGSMHINNIYANVSEFPGFRWVVCLWTAGGNEYLEETHTNLASKYKPHEQSIWASCHLGFSGVVGPVVRSFHRAQNPWWHYEQYLLLPYRARNQISHSNNLALLFYQWFYFCFYLCVFIVVTSVQLLVTVNQCISGKHSLYCDLMKHPGNLSLCMPTTCG